MQSHIQILFYNKIPGRRAGETAPHPWKQKSYTDRRRNAPSQTCGRAGRKKSKFYYNGMDGAVESVIIMLLRDLQRRRCPAVGKDGMLLRKRAEELVDLMEKTKAELTASNENINGEIYIGCGETDSISFSRS